MERWELEVLIEVDLVLMCGVKRRSQLVLPSSMGSTRQQIIYKLPRVRTIEHYRSELVLFQKAAYSSNLSMLVPFLVQLEQTGRHGGRSFIEDTLLASKQA